MLIVRLIKALQVRYGPLILREKVSFGQINLTKIVISKERRLGSGQAIYF